MTSLETEKIFQDLVGGPSGYERLVDERTPLKMSMKKSLKHSNAKPKPPGTIKNTGTQYFALKQGFL